MARLPLALVLLVAACGGKSNSNGDGGNPAVDASFGSCTTPNVVPPIKLTRVGQGFQFPVFVAQPPGDTTHLFVVEKGGHVRVVTSGVTTGEFIDVSARIYSPG